jgi:ParB-like chromosome segregation protein Spo0J
MSTEPLFPSDPINNIQWIHCDTLTANHYNPNVVLDVELRLLERSVLRTGWLQPILVNKNRIIIDGFHRWSLSRISEAMRAKYGGMVPCAVLDIPDWEAMVITVRINRAKGTHVAFRMSAMVTDLVNNHHVDPQQIAQEMGCGMDEINLLLQEDVFRVRDIQNHKYSAAWVPKPSTSAADAHP